MKNSVSTTPLTTANLLSGSNPSHHHQRHRHRRRGQLEPQAAATKPKLRNVVVPLELPPAGYQLVKTMAIQAESRSVADYILGMIAEEVQAFAEALADTSSPDLSELLTVNPKEVTRL